MTRTACLIVFLIFCQSHLTIGQGGYWVYFNDKPSEGFDPHRFFHPKAVERRLRHGQCLYDPVDIPVSEKYLEAVSALVDSMGVVTRWLNAAFVYAGPQAADSLAGLSFVRQVELAGRTDLTATLFGDEGAGGHCFSSSPGHSSGPGLSSGPDLSSAPGLSSGFGLSQSEAEALSTQIDHVQGRFFAENGLDGAGMRIAVFDAGFPGVDTHPAFEHLRRDGRIVATWDFHRDRFDVYRYNAHGTMVLSMITGIYDGHQMGLATGADFLLARTEIRREPFFEEKYWLAAAEWADMLGADIINSSLGYIHHRYFPEQMDGQTSLVAQAARIAIRKGMLVVNAAGNEGDNPRWRVIITPADVDSVMSVGAVSHPSMLRTSYSSVGPAADGATKPNLVAMGNVLLANASGLSRRQGTSFSAPLLAGFAACLWQRFPGLTNMEIFEAMQRSGSLYPYFDYSHGYGVPRAGVFFEAKQGSSLPGFDLEEQQGRLVFQLRFNPLRAEETKEQERYLYYQILDRDGRIEQYFVVQLDQSDRLALDMANFRAGQKVRFHYEGYTASWEF